MPGTSHRAPRPADRIATALRIVGAIALGYSGYLHLRIALERPPLLADGGVTLSGLFVAQAFAAAVVVIWVLVQGRLFSWLAFAAVAFGSLAALVLSTYVRIPAVGPFPVLYEPVWYADKYLAAVSAAIAGVVAAVAVLRLRRHRVRH